MVSSIQHVTLKHFLLQNSNHVKHNDIIPIIFSMEKSCRIINNILRSSISNDNYINCTNIHNEKQLSLDIISNNIIKNSLLKLECVKSIISEEENNICLGSNNGKYFVAFDPLDGSSNLKSNLPIGTIFGIYDQNQELISSGYCLYSSTINFVLSFNNSVSIFNYNNKYNLFILKKSNVQIPDGHTYSLNLDNPDMKNLLNDKISFRYSGALVADAHNILINGGLFAYPSTPKYINGKLRLLYEAKPISKIIIDAGGFAKNKDKNILDIKNKNIHERTPLFFGSNNQNLLL
jgi:fructose-1,6-bisphosphatase I